MASAPTVRHGTAQAYTIPTDAPEADGTIAWSSTTLIVVTVDCGDAQGIGYTYGHAATAAIARKLIETCVVGGDAMDVSTAFWKMRVAERNYGSEGIGATALSAIDMALWDAKAKLLRQPLCKLLGMYREHAPVYGSGGFTSYNDEQLTKQLGGWVNDGMPRVKMKVGTRPDLDSHRVEVARKAIGSDTELFIDANGAYSRKQALAMGALCAERYGVSWFEEPVSSDDLEGLRLMRDRMDDRIEVAAGEYGWNSMYLKRMIDAGAVDVIQADATRCGGVTGFMDVAAIATATPIPLSAHCGPTAHLHLACAARPLRHIEYFHDHVRIEGMLFDGFRAQCNGAMTPDLTRAGIGIELKEKDAERFRNDG